MYEFTIDKIRSVGYEYTQNDEDYINILRMIEEILKMHDPLKAARWIGYVLCLVEKLTFWDNQTSRDYIREDVKNGADGSSAQTRIV